MTNGEKTDALMARWRLAGWFTEILGHKEPPVAVVPKLSLEL